MFCPTCGSEERQRNQFCRACGTDLRAVRAGLEKPDAITASAVSAREEVARTIAAKIKEFDEADDLKMVAEDVLPELEKFLESPEERRLRRVRSGVMTAAAGLGATLFAIILSLFVDERTLPLLGAGGLVAFLVGLGIVINGLVFSIPSKRVPDLSPDARTQSALDQSSGLSDTSRVERASMDHLPLSSVTEHTTHQLPDKPALTRSPHLNRE